MTLSVNSRCVRFPPIADVSECASLFRVGHVFISYARTDREYAAKIAKLLQAAGHSVWLDDRIEPGTHFDEVIEAALDEAQRVVVIWSAASVKSQWVRAEAGEGLRRGILIPIAADLSKIPLEFRRVQALDFSSWTGDPASPEFRKLDQFLRSSDVASAHAVTLKGTPSVGLRAELVSADRYHFNIRMRLYVGERSYRVDHEGIGRRQLLKLDGKVIAEGGSWVHLEDYFRCQNVAPEIQLLEFSLRGNQLRGIDHIALRVNGDPVLSTAVPKGFDVLLAISALAAFEGIALVFVGELFGWTAAMWGALIIFPATASLHWLIVAARRPRSS